MSAYVPYANPATCFDGTEKSVIVANLNPEYIEPRGMMGMSWWKSLGYNGACDNAWKKAYEYDAGRERQIQKRINEKKNKRWLRSDTKYINELESEKYFGDQIDWFYNFRKLENRPRNYAPYYKYHPPRPYETIRGCNGEIEKFIPHYTR